jgi:hypothetical protein
MSSSDYDGHRRTLPCPLLVKRREQLAGLVFDIYIYNCIYMKQKNCTHPFSFRKLLMLIHVV